uniref:AlNc14C131G6960 protein n=1 Tax=Albugo laibachii Nc14 TaxID=890382 RepID=F0WKA7_9STRA|nr:AlNc14C131G6960 [Albugo laibachii Nc14]CCA21864.1 AlNc14C136G7097 [Albugo laibachii Nc14]|eukprot:CCA21864.1 AlNc14C136G7097 [Albugo laibachii Nc14]
MLHFGLKRNSVTQQMWNEILVLRAEGTDIPICWKIFFKSHLGGQRSIDYDSVMSAKPQF